MSLEEDLISLSVLLTAVSLAACAGVSAYLPFLAVALCARFTTFVPLSPAWNWFTSGGTIGILSALSVVEIVLDKIAVVNHLHDLLQTVLRLAAGAILFTALSGDLGRSTPMLAVVCGILISGGVHFLRAGVFRPLISITTFGNANFKLSLLEEVTVLLVCVLALTLPASLAVLMVAAACLMIYRRWIQPVDYFE